MLSDLKGGGIRVWVGWLGSCELGAVVIDGEYPFYQIKQIKQIN